MTSKQVLHVLITCFSILPFNQAALALPEDAEQPIIIEAGSSEFLLNSGIEIHRGTDSQPARIVQGTMVISGREIRVERDGNALMKVTAVGSPARFEQQPEADQEIVYARGQTLTFDNSTRLFSADEEAELMQASNNIRGFHIEYNLDTQTVRADASANGESVRIVITPEAD